MSHHHHHEPTDSELLKEVIRQQRVTNKLLVKILGVEQAEDGFLYQIEQDLHPSQQITSFIIKQQGEPHMALLPIAPGFSPVFTATPVPATSVPATPPTWVSSDTTNAPITVDPTGLIATVAIPSTAVVGTAFTLTVSYTNADGTVATGSISLTIVAAPSPDITSFTIAQTT